ncbi:MADS-box transcription factor 50, partial [Ananas comosus]
SVQKTIDRYKMHMKEPGSNKRAAVESIQHWKSETARLANKIEVLEAHKRKLMGEGIEPCSTEELRELEAQLEKSLSNVRATKQKMLLDHISVLKEQERMALRENAVLREKCKVEPLLQLTIPEGINTSDQASPNVEVETELIIGRPGTSDSR